MNKRVAVPSMGEEVCQHYGRSQTFKVFNIANGQIEKTEVISINNPDHQHQGIVSFLQSHQINTVICNWIGAQAIANLNNAGIEVLHGIKGNIQDIAQAYINNMLVGSTEICDRSPKYVKNIECLCDY